jgi:phosphatidylserine decarboxylase
MYDIYESIRRLFVPIHKEGYPFILIGVILLVLGFLWWEPLGWIFAILTLWVCYFFRDPRADHAGARRSRGLAGRRARVPGHGRRARPPELGLPPETMQRVSIFMNVFDCHVNRAPVAGQIARVVYTPGLFLNADLDKASEDNERSAMVIETGGAAVGVVQIAGLVARRIVSFVRAGDAIGAGERFGLIRFGSRVDVYLPTSARVLVGAGQLSVAGETVLADLSADEPPRLFRAD